MPALPHPPGALPALPPGGWGLPGRSHRGRCGTVVSFSHGWKITILGDGLRCMTRVRTQTTANHTQPRALPSYGGRGGGHGLPSSYISQVFLPLLPRPPGAPGEPVRSLCPRNKHRAVQEAMKVPKCGLSKALKSKGGGCWGPETPPQTGSSRSSCSGLQDRWARPRAGGTPGRVRKDPQVLKQKAH